MRAIYQIGMAIYKIKSPRLVHTGKLRAVLARFAVYIIVLNVQHGTDCSNRYVQS